MVLGKLCDEMVAECVAITRVSQVSGNVVVRWLISMNVSQV